MTNISLDAINFLCKIQLSVQRMKLKKETQIMANYKLCLFLHNSKLKVTDSCNEKYIKVIMTTQ